MCECSEDCLKTAQVPITEPKIVYNFWAMTLIETIYQPDGGARSMIGPSVPIGVIVMFMNSLLCSLLAAYACGASGAGEPPEHDI